MRDSRRPAWHLYAYLAIAVLIGITLAILDSRPAI